METPPRIARCLRKLWINFLADYLGWPLSGPIENIFYLVSVCLRKSATKKKIKRETNEHFCLCVTNTLYSFPSDIINQAIASVPKGIDAAIKMKGQRTKY